MNDWRSFALTDIATIHNERRIPLSKMERSKKQGSYPYYGASGIFDHVDDYLFDGEYVLISEDGENLKSRKTPIAFEASGKFWVNNHAHILKGIKEHHNRLLVYYFSNLDLNPFITGAVQPKLNKANLLSIPFILPSSDTEQAELVNVLSSLDDKIDLLHRQNQTLEAMSQTLFRQWFVEETGDDWEKISIRSLVDHVKNGVKPQSQPDIYFNHFSIPAFDDKQRPVRELGSDIRSSKYEVLPSSILVSKLNPRFPRIWRMPSEIPLNSICSTEFQVFVPKQTDLYGYLYFLLKSDEVVAELEMAASGTSGSHQRVRPDDILNITTMMPSMGKAMKFSTWCKPLLDKVHANNTQIKTLEDLRDTLLPKLMSGEVRVKRISDNRHEGE